jgi:hypothetical protein
MMMMKFIRPVLNLKGPSLYYIIHFVQSPVVDIIDDGFSLIFGVFADKSVVNYVHHW